WGEEVWRGKEGKWRGDGCVVRLGRTGQSSRGGDGGHWPHSGDQPGGGCSWPHRRGWPSRAYLCWWWPARLVATAAENRLRFRRKSGRRPLPVSDCRTIAVYEYAP